MDIEQVSFGAAAGALAAPAVGVVIDVGPHPSGEAGRVVVRGACRVPRAEAPAPRIDLPRGIFLTLVEAAEQRPFTAPLVGDRLVFEDDVEIVGDDYVIDFRGVLSTVRAVTGAYFLHASFFGHVSNVVWVAP